MKTLYQSLLLALGALALAGTAFGQVPASNDTSDGFGNTGMGFQALGGPAATNGGNFNTAIGATALFSNTTGNDNTASGLQALQSNTTGNDNTASGRSALVSNTTGSYNSAFGVGALAANTTGSYNTASGWQALANNTTGNDNAASGQGALYQNTIGSFNTASGYDALYSNTTGETNTASGYFALLGNTTGNDNSAFGVNALGTNTTGNNNTAFGGGALHSNTTGNYNSASGFYALEANTTGNYNTASGGQALLTNTTGSNNVAEGYQAGHSLTTGSSNIAVGYQAGYHVTTGSNNIDIGNKGVAADAGVIRIGTQVPTALQTKAFVAGIYNVPLTGNAVVITSTGQLGVQAVSSERFKTAIAPMGSNSEKLAQLRPVTFHLKTDPHGALQYGLIAEEVARVYPELVIRNESGRIDGVRYDELAPMLLNEAQRQQRINEAQAAEMRDLKQQLVELKAINQATQVALRKLQSEEELVAQR